MVSPSSIFLSGNSQKGLLKNTMDRITAKQSMKQVDEVEDGLTVSPPRSPRFVMGHAKLKKSTSPTPPLQTIKYKPHQIQCDEEFDQIESQTLGKSRTNRFGQKARGALSPILLEHHSRRNLSPGSHLPAVYERIGKNHKHGNVTLWKSSGINPYPAHQIKSENLSRSNSSITS